MIGLGPTGEALHDAAVAFWATVSASPSPTRSRRCAAYSEARGVPDGPPEVLGEPLELLVFPEIAKRPRACRNPANQYPYAGF